MRKLIGITLVIAISGCTSNVSQVRDRGAIDLRCDPASVSVTLLERPYIGVTRYEAAGCGDTRQYECRARTYSNGLPIGERACHRNGSSRNGAVDVGTGTVGY